MFELSEGTTYRKACKNKHKACSLPSPHESWPKKLHKNVLNPGFQLGLLLQNCHQISQNPRMVWVGRDLKAYLITLPATGRNSFHYPRMLQAPSNLVLHTSSDGAATAFLDTPCQDFPTLPGKNFSSLTHQILLSVSLRPFLSLLSLSVCVKKPLFPPFHNPL